MNIVSILENQDIEKRIAITPEIAKKYISLGFNLLLPINYGKNCQLVLLAKAKLKNKSIYILFHL